MLKSDKFKVAPSAGSYMRQYKVFPDEVSASGPRGHILGGDVLEYVEKNKIEKGRSRGSSGMGKAKKESAAAPKKKAPTSGAAGSSHYDPAKPFKQSW